MNVSVFLFFFFGYLSIVFGIIAILIQLKLISKQLKKD